MSALIGCFTRIVAVLIVCAVLVVGAIWLAGGRHAAPAAGPTPETLLGARPTAAPTVTEVQPAVTAEAKLRAAEQSVKTATAGAHQPVSITMSEAEVNALAVPQLTGDRDFPLQQPNIVIQPGAIVLTGQAPVGPVTLPVTVTGTVAVNAGVPTFTVTNVQASGITAPQSLVQQLSDQLATSLRLTPANLPITVQQVTLGDHSVTISGVTK